MLASLLPQFVIDCFSKAPNGSNKPEAQFRVVFVLGGPGSGKGTMCERIVNKYSWVHLSAGDLLRAERKNPNSKDGELINERIREGQIVPVEITLGLLKKAMIASGKTDFLIDGFPRNLDNLTGFESNLSDDCSVPAVLYLETSEQVMQDRILKRANQAKAAGEATRSDDNPDAIKKRFKTYIEATMPIIEHYRSKGILYVVDSTPSADTVFAKVRILFDRLTALST
uniref:UMP-CMP kinase n=1 Tax=Aureoumbra lagunensis TaxID=44058 RepID=A0A7S3NHA5_9STRA|mmetsp:Transcript_20899/g.27111  ORF Transcript_20899/g.27111 Transcript_20899/m.27111 type:complete len:227 (+) Transcript_20899:167-847(+)